MIKRESAGIGKQLLKEAINIIAESEEGSVGLAELYATLKEKRPDLCDDSDTYDRGRNDGRPKWKVQLSSFSSPSLTGGKPLFEKGNGEWSLTEYGWEWFERLKSMRENTLPAIEPEESARADSDLPELEAEESTRTDSGLTEEEQDVADYVLNKEPPKGEKKGKWFEHTVAALLRGMGYEYVHVTKQSWDGGVDVVAYKDDLGIVEPRLKVQVKHYTKEQKVNDDAVLRLANVIHKGEVGMCVTSSSFGRSAESFALTSNKHLLLVHRERFAQLWVKYRDKMTQEDRDRIPVSTDNKKRKGENASN